MTSRRSGGGRPPRGRPPGGRRSPASSRSRSWNLPAGLVAEIRSTARGSVTEEALRLAEQAAEALAKDRPADAERAAARLKQIAPRSAGARELLGMAHYRRGLYREAVRELQAYRRMSGRADQNHLIADSHRALGTPDKAPPLAREALEAQVSAEAKAEAVVVGAAALADLGRYEEALTLLRRFRTSPDRARPYDLRVWYVTGDVLERAGQRRAAADEFRKIVRHDPDAFDTAERLAALG